MPSHKRCLQSEKLLVDHTDEKRLTVARENKEFAQEMQRRRRPPLFAVPLMWETTGTDAPVVSASASADWELDLVEKWCL